MMCVMEQLRKITWFTRHYPVPILALLGLIVGGALQATNEPQAGKIIWLITLILGGIPVVWQTMHEILHKHFVADIVAMLAIIVSIILNDSFPGMIIVLMQSGGKALEDYAYRRASSSLDNLLSHAPRIAHRKIDHDLEEIQVSQINIGDTLVIKSGDVIPVDGEILSMVSRIDESSLTGEPLPKTKTNGDQVFSGTVNIGDVFDIKATRKSEESQYSKIVNLVKKAQHEKAPIQRMADKYAIWFTPITLVASISGWLVTNNFETILAVLVVATPCSLIFATPVAIISGINRAAKSGIIVKTGAAMEHVAKTQVAVFDKTGTITHGTPAVERILSFDVISSEDILLKAASLEQLSSHPIASMIVQKGKEKFGKLLIPENFREISGAGVEGRVGEDHIMIGSPSIFANVGEGIFNNTNVMTDKIKSKGRMVAFVAFNGRLSGAIMFGDEIRPDVKTMIQQLKIRGVKKTVLLTGDIKNNAKNIAEQSGIIDYEANLIPEEKVVAVKKLRQEFENVTMIGDGINDAPALAASTVGIAMGAKGTAISAEAADIVFLVDRVSKIIDVIDISKRTIKVAKQSILVGLGGSFFFMAIAMLGHLPPAIGAILQEVLDVSVILNALRAR
ncbi:Cation transport ATPase [Candidatus Nitrosotalea okcheonensis]|uniref:Cation transport ATPase n=2 Tax=Candidatus Nitrosotalea okcheonensis TaxID=1903276 RepID=A0A2H1FD97_9ARCH|nr:Cation transport ATPase [Candidatus Nitrosotalea okcheonensis]